MGMWRYKILTSASILICVVVSFSFAIARPNSDESGDCVVFDQPMEELGNSYTYQPVPDELEGLSRPGLRDKLLDNIGADTQELRLNGQDFSGDFKLMVLVRVIQKSGATLRHLDLSYTNINMNSIDALLFLKIGPLHYLGLRGNALDYKGLNHLAYAFKKTREWNVLSPGGAPEQNYDSPRLRTLDLGECTFAAQAIVPLVRSLNFLPFLESLRLDGASFSDPQLNEIAAIIMFLRKLDSSRNLTVDLRKSNIEREAHSQINEVRQRVASSATVLFSPKLIRAAGQGDIRKKKRGSKNKLRPEVDVNRAQAHWLLNTNEVQRAIWGEKALLSFEKKNRYMHESPVLKDLYSWRHRVFDERVYSATGITLAHKGIYLLFLQSHGLFGSIESSFSAPQITAVLPMKIQLRKTDSSGNLKVDMSEYGLGQEGYRMINDAQKNFSDPERLMLLPRLMRAEQKDDLAKKDRASKNKIPSERAMSRAKEYWLLSVFEVQRAIWAERALLGFEKENRHVLKSSFVDEGNIMREEFVRRLRSYYENHALMLSTLSKDMEKVSAGTSEIRVATEKISYSRSMRWTVVFMACSLGKDFFVYDSENCVTNDDASEEDSRQTESDCEALRATFVSLDDSAGVLSLSLDHEDDTPFKYTARYKRYVDPHSKVTPMYSHVKEGLDRSIPGDGGKEVKIHNMCDSSFRGKAALLKSMCKSVAEQNNCIPEYTCWVKSLDSENHGVIFRRPKMNTSTG